MCWVKVQNGKLLSAPDPSCNYGCFAIAITLSLIKLDLPQNRH